MKDKCFRKKRLPKMLRDKLKLKWEIKKKFLKRKYEDIKKY